MSVSVDTALQNLNDCGCCEGIAPATPQRTHNRPGLSAIAYRVGTQAADNEWGYSGIEPSREAFLRRLDGLVKALRANPVWAGYCYTQLTDVEQEINGLMTYDRKPKTDPAEFAKIFNQR